MSGATIPASLDELLAVRARDEPDRVQYRFLESGGVVDMTLGELDRAAAGLATRLRGIDGGGRILLALPAGRPFVLGFFASIRAGAVPVPVAPPGRTRVESGLEPARRVLLDCDARCVLTTAAIASAIDAHLEPDDPVRAVPVLAVERELTAAHAGGDGPGPAIDRRADDIAYLQYTSGSMTTPRGVRITNANVLANLAVIAHGFGMRRSDTGVIWLPPHHDMGLVGGILAPLHQSFPVVLASPQTFLQSPIRWLRWITDHGATISGGPDFAYRLLADRVRDGDLHDLDLSTWRVAFTGAEPVSPDTIERVVARLAPVGLRPDAVYPCYGLAESTLMVTGGPPGGGPDLLDVDRAGLERERVARPASDPSTARRLVGAGSPAPGHDLRVVDADRAREVPPRSVGEIWIRGPSVAAGYHGTGDDPAFGARLDGGEGPFLRTGDEGFVLDGRLFVTGRRKDVIVVEGRNLDAHDVEGAVQEAVQAPRQGLTAAFGTTDESGERFVVVHEVGRSTTTPDELRARIQQAIGRRFGARADEVLLVRIGSLPRTTSGKLRRAETRRRHRDNHLDVLVTTPEDGGNR